MSARPPPPTSFFVLVALTALLAVVRMFAAARVGFGDSEALYAAYALHPQPAYLDHPGLIGVLASAIGGGTSPTPIAAHQVTTALAAVVPWLMAMACRAAGASWRAALTAAIAFAVVPEIAVGLFAMTPDLLLALTWTGSLALAALGLRATPASGRAAWLLGGAGVMAGAACASKATGALLIVSLASTYVSRHARPHARTLWPWAGLAAGLVIAVPIALYEAKSGWPMVHHRLVDTQSGAGVSLRNAGAIVGGQLAYLSPLYVVAAFLVGRDLVRRRGEDATSALLFHTLAVPLGALVVLALWSRVAEPHWLAPPLLALPVHYARSSERLAWRRSFAASVVASGVFLSAAVHAWVLVPGAVRLLPASADPRFDISNELFGWPRAVQAVAEVVAAERSRSEESIVVVGPHWTVCAQLHAALRESVPVGCNTEVRDDFDAWLPRPNWQNADKLLLVTDNRYPLDAAALFPGRAPTMTLQVTVMRGGRVARVFSLTLLERRAAA